MDYQTLISLITKRTAKIGPYLQKNKIEAFRLLNPIHGYFSFAVDIYKDNAVIHIFEKPDENELDGLESALQKTMKINSCFYKNRTKENISLPTSARKEITINEYGNTFLVNLSDYLDTGLFPDHRETRKWIGALSKGKKVLNTFAYTSSFSVYAARGGAALTHSVDLSKTYCEWSKKNFELNGMSLEKNWVLKMDTREYFKYAKKKGFKFDIIIIDPPTFSRNKGYSFSVQKDHPELIVSASQALLPGGFILFSNNYQEFSLNKNKLQNFKIKEITQDHIPADFGGIFVHKSFQIFVRRQSSL